MVVHQNPKDGRDGEEEDEKLEEVLDVGPRRVLGAGLEHVVPRFRDVDSNKDPSKRGYGRKGEPTAVGLRKLALPREPHHCLARRWLPFHHVASPRFLAAFLHLSCEGEGHGGVVCLTCQVPSLREIPQKCM